MKYRHPLRQILSQTRSYWDSEDTRPAVREAFNKALQCGTSALGAEVYASESQERIVWHTCKSRACPSCGHRSTIQWQRERWAALPDVPYKGITFTMPDVLWQLFRDNLPLTRALPTLVANIVQAWAGGKYGLRVGIMAVLHTFNGRLEFNSHVHAMVTAGGLKPTGQWVPHIYYNRDLLMELWRSGVIRLLRDALCARVLRTEMPADQVETMLARQETRWWSLKIQSLGSKEHFLRYAGRYVRRPPIAQRRIARIEERCITFWTKDKRLRCRVEIQCSPEQFINSWSQHVPERYQHGVRCFGLFSSRAVMQSSATVFTILGQKRRPQPIPLRWAEAVERDFGRNPLLDRMGKRMNWVRRLPPEARR